MPKNWMIDVLTDLRKYAIDNNKTKLVEQLDDTIHIAACEMAQELGDMAEVKHCSDEERGFIRPAFVV